MNIVYLSRSMLPSKTANSVHVMKMCQALAQNGHDVTLVACRSSRDPIASLYEHYGVKRNFQIRLLKGRTDRWTGLLVYLLNFFFYIKSIKPPDFFYGRDPFTLGIAAPLHKIPFYFEVHKPPTTYIHLLLTRSLLKNKHLSKLVVITNSLKNEYKRLFPGLPEQKIVVAPDGADIPEKTASNIATQDQRDKIVIGYVGSLYPGRGVEIIRALAEEFMQYKFLIVGGSEKDTASWRKTAPGNVCFTGFVPPKELSRYYAQMDIVLAPYQNKVSISGGGDTSRWMSPLKIFEYMAYAKPIVTSDLPVLKEVLTAGVNALLCQPECLEEWIEAVKLLSQDQALRTRIAANAYADLKKKYTWDKRVKKILAR